MTTAEDIPLGLWRGRPMRELNRDELYEVIAHLLGQLEDDRQAFDRLTGLLARRRSLSNSPETRP